MITTPNGKVLMNEQEAIQWLLDNNPLPFQCTANYVGGTEIGLGTIVNPSPAKVRVGSLIFFADSKVSTVVGVSSNSFICSNEYNDLVDDIVYVSNVQINASGHLIVTLSNGTDIDAGLIKQVSSFSINASQHLIATYNNGTSTDLGAIFSGNISISGNITATGSISAPAITGDSIIENMSGYTVNAGEPGDHTTMTKIFAGAVKNGNKLTLAYAFNITTDGANTNVKAIEFALPTAIAAKIIPSNIGGSNYADVKILDCFSAVFTSVQARCWLSKTDRRLILFVNTENMVANTEYYVRYEVTFLLSDSL